MATKAVTDQLNSLTIKENQDINILLLGETGVGKSTFINAIANYFNFTSFKKASKNNLHILIPTVITVTNEKLQQVTIKVGASDKNEYQEVGAAGTQDVKTYVFPIGEGKTKLRLIDSPGMGDPRGLEQDDINCENILAYLSQLQELHAICFLLKPTTTRRTVLFEYCFKQILSRLEKSASRNLIFIFTNTRGTFYTPGDTLPCLKTVIDDIKEKHKVEIPLKENIFSLDNEAFRYLVALKDGVHFSDGVEQKFVESWDKSAKECLRLISYITGDISRDGLKPHQLLNTISINEARRIIVQLSQPLADITQLVQDNLRILDRHQNNLRYNNESLEEMKQKLYIPAITLNATKLTQPVTVCTSTKCADLLMIEGVRKWHYKQRCHDPCYLTNVVREIVGDPNLANCAAMSGRTCMKCTCDFTVHMHIYYMTETASTRLVDQEMKNNICRKEEAIQESHKLIRQIDERKRQLEEERDIIIRSTAQFAHFLQHNAITPYNDAYKAYIEYLIDREKSLGRNGDSEMIHTLEDMMVKYNEIKATFDKSLELANDPSLKNCVIATVTPRSVMDTIHSLYRLKHNGKKIHELLTKQKESRNSEYGKTCEYIHPQNSSLTTKPQKPKKGSKTDDERKDKTTKKKSKSGHKTDDEGKKTNPKPQTDDESRRRNVRMATNNEDRRRYFRPPPPLMGTNFRPVEPPPPYDESTSRHNITQGGKKDGVCVKIEVSQDDKSRGGYDYRSANYPPYGPSGAYYPPQGPAGGYQPPHGPAGGYYPPPGPTGPYYPPPHGYYPPHGYHPPPQGYYPPQHGYYPPQSHLGNEPAPRLYVGNQGGRGRRNYNRGGANNRGGAKVGSRKEKKQMEDDNATSSDSSSD